MVIMVFLNMQIIILKKSKSYKFNKFRYTIQLKSSIKSAVKKYMHKHGIDNMDY